jgi:dTDP-4-amino-4,6-dideoxygalactose transaminase
MITVNRPFLPPKHEFDALVQEVWGRNWLTNHGPLVQKFQQQLSEYLGLENFLFVNNGTTALMLAIRALDLKGEIITTPYSYVATTSSIVWQNCTPVFCDIEEDTLTINPDKVEEAITGRTSAILATHVYGNPCDVEAIQKIAKQHGLSVIYDAAHCFGVKYKGRSILEYGDISAISFHATKVLHTVEGGGLVAKDGEVFKKLTYLMNFGHDGPYEFKEVGINAKNSEMHAAMGLCNLNHADHCLGRRRNLARFYDEKLSDFPVKRPQIRNETETNYGYYPVIFEDESSRKKVERYLANHSIETRSYFRPSLNKLPYTNDFEVPVSERVASQVLCLPFYYDLTPEQIELITTRIGEALLS